MSTECGLCGKETYSRKGEPFWDGSVFVGDPEREFYAEITVMKYGIPTPEKLPLLDVNFCDDCKERIMQSIAFFSGKQVFRGRPNNTTHMEVIR